MTVAIVTAGLGQRTLLVEPLAQTEETVFVPMDDTVLPPRPCAMTSRLLARLPKCWAWSLVPGHDAYLWLDAALTVAQPNTVAWWLEQLGEADVALFRHPYRETVGEEAAFLRANLGKSRRLMDRYQGEYLDAQMAVVDPMDPLYAAGAFLYRPTRAMQAAMRAWWEHNTRYHLNDQLSLPHCLAQAGAQVSVIDLDIFNNPYLTKTVAWR